ncbi:MAG: hypothetical protein HKN43_15550, partial [Rhodothermales bacterium]|nr:hypothetical protein [Rhodothermales bacterium]
MKLKTRTGLRQIRKAVALLALTGVFGSPQMIADDSGVADVMDNLGCLQDESDFSLNCTANDIQIMGVQNLTILDDGCLYPGDTVTFSANYEISLSGDKARHDVGIWFSQDGDPNGQGAFSGTCSAATLGYIPPSLDLDGTGDSLPGANGESNIQDTCGDIDADNNPLFPSITLTVACVDNDGDGQLDLPACTSWRQKGSNELCTSPEQTLPGSPSKCGCDTEFGVAIPVPGQIASINVVTVDANGETVSDDSGFFDFELTGPDLDLPEYLIANNIDVTATSSGLDAGIYNLIQAPNVDWELISADCTSEQGQADQDLIATGGNVTVGNGELLNCTFINQVIAADSSELATANDTGTSETPNDESLATTGTDESNSLPGAVADADVSDADAASGSDPTAVVEEEVAYIVRFKPGLAAINRKSAMSTNGGKNSKSIAKLDMEVVRFPASSHAGKAAAMAKNPNVVRIELDRTRAIASIPNDTDFSQQWSLPKIGWDQAYGVIAPAGTATVAVLDTGIDGTHPDLVANIIPGTSILDGSNGLTDSNGHGTSLAGIVAAETSNS